MKKYLILVIITIFYFSLTARAQHQVINHFYNFDTAKVLKDPTKPDTLTIKETDSIQVSLGNIDLNGKGRLIKIDLLKNNELSQDVTTTLPSKHLLIEEDNAQALLMIFKIRQNIVSSNSAMAASLPDSNAKIFRLVLYKAKEKKEKTVDEKIKEAVEERVSGLFTEKTDSKKVLMFTLNNKKILPLNPRSADSLLIDSVSITFLNGKITRGGMYVKLTNGDYYRNQRRSFSLGKKNYNKYLYIDNLEGLNRIKFLDAIDFTYLQRFNYPDNGTITLTRKKDTIYIENKTTISNLLNIAIYSDLLALIGRKANGIIQTELDANFITNTRTWTKFDFTPFSFINPYFGLSKFDSKFQQIDSSKVGKNNKDSIDRLYINQTAYLRAGLRFNFAKISLWPNQEMQINGGSELVLTNADSIFKKDIVTINYYPEIIYRVNRMDNFGLEVAARWLIQVPSKNIEFFNSKPVVFFNPQVSMYYFPFSDPNKRIYLRYNHFAEIGAGKSNYPQIQFGYKTNLFKKD
jgi:hypothetical protein